MVAKLQLGARFGYLTVVQLVGVLPIGHQHVMHQYECVCDCGNRIVCFQGELLSGHVKSCGCRTRIRNFRVKYDLTGQRFGRLVVLEQSDTWWSDSGKTRMIRWKCRCDCGKIVVVNGHALRTGATQSCGCYQKERVSEALTDDLTGQRFGHLVVIERAGSHRTNNRQSGVSAMWKCRCDCGQEIVTFGWSLKVGDTLSCGCSKRSIQEEYVESCLNQLGYEKNVTYFCEKTFPDLISSRGGYLRFDFVVMTSQILICIECQGKQHYVSVKYFGGDDAFLHRLENDEQKRVWCKEHNVCLIEIPYTMHTKEEICSYITELMDGTLERQCNA